MISKGERAELRSIVKQQFKVLRSEVQQREAEMHAEVENEIIGKFATDDRQWEGVTHVVHEATMEANRRINDALREAGYQASDGLSEHMWLSTPHIRKPEEKRQQLRKLASSRIYAQVRAALLQLDRQEADLLRNLAVGAIESEEAREFLTAIPTVGELVPATRLAELEAAAGVKVADRLMEEHGVPTHPRAAEFTCPKWDEPGRCICGAELPKRSEWQDAIHQWASIECPACGRGYVDEDDFIAIYDAGLDREGGDEAAQVTLGRVQECIEEQYGHVFDPPVGMIRGPGLDEVRSEDFADDRARFGGEPSMTEKGGTE